MGFDTPNGGGGAPTDSPYLTSGADPDLSNETVVNSPENVPDWEEDPNSPFDISGSVSSQFSLADSYTAVKMIWTNGGTVNLTLSVEVNGDSGSNYTFIDLGGTQTTGAVAFSNVSNTARLEGQHWLFPADIRKVVVRDRLPNPNASASGQDVIDTISVTRDSCEFGRPE